MYILLFFERRGRIGVSSENIVVFPSSTPFSWDQEAIHFKRHRWFNNRLQEDCYRL